MAERKPVVLVDGQLKELPAGDTLPPQAPSIITQDASNRFVTDAEKTTWNAKAPTASPTFTGTVNGITKAMVGLGNVDNTSDANKPVSTATQTALDAKAPLANPTFTGLPSAPTAAVGTNTTQLATTAHVFAERAATATLTNKTLESAAITKGYTEGVYSLTGTAINPVNGSIQYKILSSNTTLTASIADGQSVVLMLNPGTFAVTWPTMTWIKPEGATWTAPTMKASAYNALTIFKFGGVLYGRFEGSV